MKPLRLLFTADWQATLSNLDRCQITLEQILKIIHEEGCDYVVHLGDVKDAFNPLDVRVSNWLVHAVREIKKRCPMLVLMGNHDLIAPQDEVPSILPVLEAAGADVFDGPRYRYLRDMVSLWMIPYIRNEAKQVLAFELASHEAALTKGVKILCFHCAIDGCKQNVWTKGKGIVLKDLQPKSYDLCVGGHIHIPQSFAHVHYVGSPFCVDWSEVNSEHRHLLVTVQGKTVTTTSIPSVIPCWYDPSAPGFEPPRSWKGTRVRITVPIQLDPQLELSQARSAAEKKYPDAVIDVVPDFQTRQGPDTVDASGGDRQVLAKYLEDCELPQGYCAEQVISYLSQYLPHGAAFGVQPLHFIRAEATNTLCFDRVALEIDQKGLILVSGRNKDWGQTERSNGAGKSALLSLPWIALFGKTPKGQIHDAWARRGNDKTATVSLTLKLPDNRVMRIVRARRPASLRVWTDGKEVTMGRPEQTQALIERLTNLTWDVLTNSVCVGQREIGSVFGTDKERKELFSRLLGLDRFLEAQEKLRKKISRHSKALIELNTEAAAVESARREAQMVLSQVEGGLASAPQVDPQESASLEAELQKLDYEIDRLKADNAAIEPKLTANQKEFEGLLFKAADIEGRMNQMREMVKETERVKDGQCPTCGSRVSVKTLEQYLAGLQKKIREADEELAVYERKQETNRRLRKETMLDVVAANLGTIQKHTMRSATLRQAQAVLKAQIDARQRLEADRDRRRARVNELDTKAALLIRARSWYLSLGQFLEFCSETVSRDGLPAFLCGVAAPHLNAAAEQYSRLFADDEISIEFTADAGGLDVAIKNLHGGDEINDQSHGEIRMAALIAVFAFRSVLVNYNMLALDEPGEGLDAANAMAFTTGLNSVAGRFGSLFLVTHNQHILSTLNPDIRLFVVKHNKVSTVTLV